MKNLFILVCLFISTILYSQTSTKTLVKTVVVDNPTVLFNIENYDINYWDESYIKVIMNIETDLPERTLSMLIGTGRYELNKDNRFDKTIYSIPKLERKISFDDIPIKETVYIECWIPKNIVIENN